MYKDDGSIMFWKKYSRQHFADELANIVSNITSGDYDKWQNFKHNCESFAKEGERRVLLCLDGGLEIWGGVTEFELGKDIAVGGSVLTDGVATPIAVPVGGTLMLDGGNSAIEGGEKIIDSIFNTNWFDHNLLRDKVFKSISPKNGKDYYNKFSLTCGITCLAGDWKTLEPSVKTGFKVATTEDVVKEVPRTQHIKLAEKLNLPTEKVTEQKVNQVIFDEIRKTTKTPMVLYREVNKNLSTSDCFIDFTNKYRKDIFSTGVDIRNTNGTYNSVFSSKNQDNKEESK